MNEVSLETFCKQAGISELFGRFDEMQKFVDLFVEKNKAINLTKFEGCEEFYSKHIYDAFMVCQFFKIKSGMKVADLGTGGGLPGIPLAILHPEAQFTLIDSVQKKIKCVSGFADELKLDNVEAISERLELIGQDKKYRETFDLVLARALAPLPTLLELAMPLVKTGGTFIAMKGPGYLEEINGADNAMRQLKISLPTVERYELPDEAGKRYLLFFSKKKPTPPQYPRRIGVPKKSPL